MPDMTQDEINKAAGELVAELLESVKDKVSLSIEASTVDTPEKVVVDSRYSDLRAVVVGRADNDVLPLWYPSFSPGDSNEVDDPGAAGKTKEEYNPEMQRKCIEQIDSMCDFLEKEGVQIFRPPLISRDVAKADPVGLTAVYVRECFTVIGSRLIVNQSRTPHRNKDHVAMEPFFSALEQKQLCTVHRPPQCTFEKNDDLRGDQRPFIEGGDIFVLGDDVIVTMSYLATSPTGFKWLADLLAEDGIEAWPAYMTEEWEHGDYIFMPVREGLCVAYLDGFADGLLPSPVTDWNCITLTHDEANNRFAANGIVLRENVVLLPSGSPRVVRALERKGVDVIEVPYDGPSYWQGAIDCSTSALWRE